MTGETIFDHSTHLIRALLWKDSAADKFQVYVNKKTELADARLSVFWADWYRDVFDIDTANRFGLAVWARVLDINITVEETQSIQPPIGFSPFGGNFYQSNFSVVTYSGLTLEQIRIVIKLRLYQLTGRASVFEVNRFLHEQFNGELYAYDNLNMTFVTYYFTVPQSSSMKVIIENFDLLPRPAGVGLEVIEPLTLM
jgi:hypothetical protein